MRWIKPLLFLAGLGLLALIIAEIDLAETWHLLSRVGIGILLILCIYFLAFLIDTFTWQLTIKHVPLSPLWIYRFFQMRLAGEAFNNITPLAGMGGEVVNEDEFADEDLCQICCANKQNTRFVPCGHQTCKKCI